MRIYNSKFISLHRWFWNLYQVEPWSHDSSIMTSPWYSGRNRSQDEVKVLKGDEIKPPYLMLFGHIKIKICFGPPLSVGKATFRFILLWYPDLNCPQRDRFWTAVVIKVWSYVANWNGSCFQNLTSLTECWSFTK